jgi:hypothetical protein
MWDGSPTNNCVERAGGQRGGCNAHGRRRLVEALRGGDERAADALTLITTCKKLGIDPRGYLRAALARILAGDKDLEALLPERDATSSSTTAQARAA